MNEAPRSKTRFPVWWLYAGFGLFMLAMLTWATLRNQRDTPSTQSSVEVPGRGWVTLTLFTNPYPPLATGPVQIDVRAEDRRGQWADLGPSLPFSIGSSPGESLQSGEAQRAPDGMYQADVQFPAPGNYWLAFELADQSTVEFQVYVEPAQ